MSTRRTKSGWAGMSPLRLRVDSQKGIGVCGVFLYLGAGGRSLYASCPLERAFHDVHAITLHIGVHPRVMETTCRVLFGLEPLTPAPEVFVPALAAWPAAQPRPAPPAMLPLVPRPALN
jgi:hypothetical protein